MRKILKIFAALCIVMLAAAFAWSAWAGSQVAEVEVVRPAVIDLVVRVEETGKIALKRTWTIRTMAAGVLSEVALEPGDAVEKGAVLCTVDSTRLQHALGSCAASLREIEAQKSGIAAQLPRAAEIERSKLGVKAAQEALGIERKALDAARSELALASKECERAQALSAGGHYAAAGLDRLEAARDAAQAKVASIEGRILVAEIEIESAQKNASAVQERAGDGEPLRNALDAARDRILEEIAALEADMALCDVRAPFAGVVLERMTRGRAWFPGGTPVARIGDLSLVQVEVELLSDDAARIAAGAAVEISGRALAGRVVTGRVGKIDPEAFTRISSLGIEQQRVRVVIEPDEPVTGLIAGSSVEVRIESQKAAGAVCIPEKAIFTREREQCVFAVRGGKIEIVAIETGFSDGDMTQVLSGIENGEMIVASPDKGIAEGKTARILNDGVNAPVAQR